MKVAFMCDSGKAPDPDEFTFNLIKSNWEVMKTDICTTVRRFEATGCVGFSCNSSFITLIPKFKDSLLVSEFRLSA